MTIKPHQLINSSLEAGLFSSAVFAKALAKETKSKFLTDVVAYQIDRVNLKTMLRVLTIDQKTSEEVYLKGGSLSLESFMTPITAKTFAHFLLENDFLHLGLQLKESKNESVQDLLLEFEKEIEAEMMQMFMDAEEGEIGSVQIPLVYFLKRVKNARILKFIMYAKIYGLDPEKIYETIKHF